MIIEDTELKSMWEGIIHYVGKLTQKGNIESLFSNTRLLSVSKDKAVVSVPNQFLGDIIAGQYYTSVLDSVKHILGISINQIQITVDDRHTDVSYSGEDSPLPQSSEKGSFGLNPLYTFSSFVVGEGSRFAHAASVRVSENPGNAYNPLFIYGDVGLGKTHLLSAVGNALLSQFPTLKIVYVTSEHFTNDVITSLRYQKMDEFRNRYRNIDVLLIDDIQFISGKERTQEEFFHTFNTLYKENKQVVFSADRSAKEISGVDERLRSRFEMGLMADIQPPDLETKIAILYKKAEKEGITLTQEVANFIAQGTRSNVRELEGALIRLGAYSSLVGQEMTLQSARHVLKDISIKREIHIDDVQKVVANHFSLKGSDLKSKRRTKQIVVPRQLAMYLCREMTKSSFPEIGSAFGGKDHSTVIYACHQIEKDIQHDEKLCEDIKAIKTALNIGER